MHKSKKLLLTILSLVPLASISAASIFSNNIKSTYNGNETTVVKFKGEKFFLPLHRADELKNILGKDSKLNFLKKFEIISLGKSPSI